VVTCSRLGLIVQRMTSTWTKRTRGAAGRERRAHLPAAYPLPDAVLVSRSASVCHDISGSEASAYRELFSVAFDAQPTARTGTAASSAVQLKSRDAGLEVAFTGCVTDTGRPVRSPMLAKVLRSGQVATVRFNGRFVGHEQVWYEDKIVMIAFDIMPSRDLFLSASAVFVIDARVDLW
jgi:hypothetical protein